MKKKYAKSPFIINVEESGKRFRKFRSERHLSLTELSKQTGFSMGMLSAIESGKNKPSPNLMLAMNRLFGANINWLLTGEGEPIDKTPLERPTKDLNGQIIYDINSLFWFMEQVPIVRFALLGFFSQYCLEHESLIKKSLNKV